MEKEKILDQEEKDIIKEQVLGPVGDTIDGNIEKEMGEEKDVKVIIEMLNKKAKESFSPKYQKELANLAKEDPTAVMIETPEGWMTVAEALKKGFNPVSGQFDRETIEERIDKIIAEQGLHPDEAARIKEMVLRKEGVVPKEEVIEETSQEEEIPQEEEETPQEEASIDPALLATLGGE